MIAYSAGWTRARLCHSQSRIRSAAMKVSTAPKKSLGTHLLRATAGLMVRVRVRVGVRVRVRGGLGFRLGLVRGGGRDRGYW